jgi:hypothetical protein
MRFWGQGQRVQSPPHLHGTTAPMQVLYARAVVQGTEKPTGAVARLEALIQTLERSGAEPRRLDALRCAQRFKRSWVELAETLVDIRRTRAYEAWDYDDFHKYCGDELHLRRATVDKLTASFSTLQRLAPQVLQWDGIAKEIPSLQAVEYFGKALGVPDGDAANDTKRAKNQNQPPREVIKELRQAVFDEGQSVAELRKRFDPILRPKPKGAEQLETIRKALGATRRLVEVLPEIDGLDERRIERVEKALGGLRQELEQLAEPLREKMAEKKTRRRAAEKSVSRASGPRSAAK